MTEQRGHKILSPTAAQPTLAQNGIVSRAQPTASRHKLCPEHSLLPCDTNCAQSTSHTLTTQIVPKAKPTLLRRKLCPQHSPHSYDANYAQSKAHTLTTQIVPRAKPTLLRRKLCPEQSPHSYNANCAQSIAHSHSRLLTSSLPNTNIVIFCSPLVVCTACRNLKKLRFATHIIYAFSMIHAINID
jgi:hypothetical protein